MSNDKKNVVCDTSIWYQIADGKINPDQYKDYNLIGTFINAYELSRSPAIIKKSNIWNKAVDYFFGITKELRTHQPTKQLRKISGLPYEIHSYVGILSELRKVKEMPNKNTPENLKKIEDSKKKHEVEASDLMEQIDEIRNNLYNKYGYKNYVQQISQPEKRIEQHEIAKQLFSRLHENIDIDWENIPLLRDTFDEWFFQLIKIKNLKLKNNDVSDFMNLMYVNPGELYWTKDDRKTKKFRLNP